MATTRLAATSKFVAGHYGVWRPGLKKPFVSLDSLAKAKAYVKAHGKGVVLNPKGQVDAKLQVWSGWSSYQKKFPAVLVAISSPSLPGAAAPSTRPGAPPAVGGVTDPQAKPAASAWLTAPTPTDAATAKKLGDPTVGGVSLGPIRATATGADVKMYIATTQAKDTASLVLGQQIFGNWQAMYRIPDTLTLPSAGWNTVTLHIDYAAVDGYLKSVNPSLGFAAGMTSAIGITFSSGHKAGLPGWSHGQTDAIFDLPAQK